MTFNPGQAAQQAALQAQQAAQQAALRNGAVIQNQLAARLRPTRFEIRRAGERAPRIRPLKALLGLLVLFSTALIALASCPDVIRHPRQQGLDAAPRLMVLSILNTMEINMPVVPATRSPPPPLSPLAIDASLSPSHE